MKKKENCWRGVLSLLKRAETFISICILCHSWSLEHINISCPSPQVSTGSGLDRLAFREFPADKLSFALAELGWILFAFISFTVSFSPNSALIPAVLCTVQWFSNRTLALRENLQAQYTKNKKSFHWNIFFF